MTVGFKGRSTLAVLVGFALVGCTERGTPDGTQSAGTPVVTTVPVSGTTMSSTTGGTMPNTTGPSGLQRSSPDPMAAPLLGLWVRDDVGPVLTYQRRFQFNADGSYQFLLTSRNPGSVSGTVVAREDGRFRVHPWLEPDEVLYRHAASEGHEVEQNVTSRPVPPPPIRLPQG